MTSIAKYVGHSVNDIQIYYVKDKIWKQSFPNSLLQLMMID